MIFVTVSKRFYVTAFFGFPGGALGTDFRCVSSIFLSHVIGITLS